MFLIRLFLSAALACPFHISEGTVIKQFFIDRFNRWRINPFGEAVAAQNSLPANDALTDSESRPDGKASLAESAASSMIPPNLFLDDDSLNGMQIVNSKFGAGMKGNVAHVQFPNKEDEYALKTISKWHIGNIPNGREHTISEIVIQRELDHPNVVKLLFAYEDRENVYIVTELCHGGNLGDSLFSASKRLTEEQTKRLAWKLSHGIKCLHDHKIVHRDLNLENICLSKTGIPKISGFGVARKVIGKEMFLGTVGSRSHWAPETLLGTSQSFPGDIWAFGVMIYTMMHGFLPFSNDNELETIQPNVLSFWSSFRLYHEIPVTPALVKLMKGMLRKFAKSRYTIEQVIADPWFDDVRDTKYSSSEEV